MAALTKNRWVRKKRRHQQIPQQQQDEDYDLLLVSKKKALDRKKPCYHTILTSPWPQSSCNDYSHLCATRRKYRRFSHQVRFTLSLQRSKRQSRIRIRSRILNETVDCMSVVPTTNHKKLLPNSLRNHSQSSVASANAFNMAATPAINAFGYATNAGVGTGTGTTSDGKSNVGTAGGTNSSFPMPPAPLFPTAPPLPASTTRTNEPQEQGQVRVELWRRNLSPQVVSTFRLWHLPGGAHTSIPGNAFMPPPTPVTDVGGSYCFPQQLSASSQHLLPLHADAIPTLISLLSSPN